MNGEYNRLLQNCKYELDDILSWINKNPADGKVKYLVSYAVIKASGTVEVVYKTIIYDYLSEGASAETTKYLETEILDSSSNPKTGNIEQLLQKLNQNWRNKFQTRCKELPQMKSDLNSLVQCRNDFSHGGNITQSIQTIIKYFTSAIKILEILYDVIHEQNEA
ncbi:MAG: hypothetical protein ATN33_03835 [Epulopiscium sp. Nele67-Bin001]|nr:MAG: hypothetical protein ATN33_03835 [Epulopiscium sp. Nele67-Bin001]